MPNVDPNVYALNIQLSLDSANAFSALDQFQRSITSVEEQVSTAAEKAIQNVANITQQIETSLNSLTGSISQVDMGAANVAASLNTINRAATDTQDTTEEDLDNLIKQRDLWEEIVDFYDEITVSLTKHLKLHNHDIKLLDNIHKAILTKNTGHSEENDLIKIEDELIQKADMSARRHGDSIKGLRNLWHGVVGSIAGVFRFFQKLDEGTEAFAQTNYRAYGSQQLLLQSTRELSSELGVSQDTAIATYKALADVRTPRLELEKYAKTIAMANRTTGANVQSLATYSARLRMVGFNADETTKHITELTEQMRKFGLTGDDISRSIDQQGASMARLRLMLGGNEVAIKDFVETQSAIKGFAKQMGMATEEVDKMSAHMADPGAWTALGNRVGMQISNVDDLKVAYLRFGKEFSDMQAQLDASNDPQERLQLTYQMESLSEAFLGTAHAGQVLADTYQKASAEAGGAAATTEHFNEAIKTLTKTQDDQYAESNNTLTAQLRILKNTFGALLGSVGSFIGDGLKELIFVLNVVLKPIAEAVTWFMKTLEMIEKNIPAVGWMIKVIKVLAAVFIVAGAALIAFVGGFSMFSMGIGLASRAITGAINVVVSIAQAMVAIAQAIGQSIIIILSSIGQGLASLGRSVQPVIVPLLALGLALILVATAAWIFANAVKIVADVGWAAVPAIIGLVVAIGVLGAILVFLGGLAQGPVALGILVVAGAILLVGIAAVLAGFGLMLAAKGLEIIAEVISVEMVMLLPALAVGLAALGLAAVIAYPGLMLLGVALLFVSAGAYIIGPAFKMIMSAVDGIDSTKFAVIAIGFMLLAPAVMALSIASLALIMAGPIFVTGAKLISIGVNYLAPAADALSKAAPALLSGAKTLGKASAQLESASFAMLRAGVSMIPGSFAIYSSLKLLQFSVSRFSQSIDQIKIVGDAMHRLATAFSVMKNAPTDRMRLAASDALSALPDIEALASGLGRVAVKLEESTRRFAKPANELSSILERLSASITEFGEGLSLTEDVAKLANMLNDYAVLLEGASERIETAVQTRAIPAIRAAEQAGLQEAVRSEAITTVKVMTDEESDSDNNRNLAEIGNAQLEALTSLVETVAGLQSGTGGNPINDILGILQAYLPSIARKDTGLSTELNGWSR